MAESSDSGYAPHVGPTELGMDLEVWREGNWMVSNKKNKLSPAFAVWESFLDTEDLTRLKDLLGD